MSYNQAQTKSASQFLKSTYAWFYLSQIDGMVNNRGRWLKERTCLQWIYLALSFIFFPSCLLFFLALSINLTKWSWIFAWNRVKLLSNGGRKINLNQDRKNIWKQVLISYENVFKCFYWKQQQQQQDKRTDKENELIPV